MNTVEKLELLNEFLKNNVPEHKFDLEDWRSSNTGNPDIKDHELLNSCGTSACAMGWACVIPEFKKLGLEFVRGGICYDNNLGILAITKFFNFDFTDTTRYLFFIETYRTTEDYLDVSKWEVINRIERLIFYYGREDFKAKAENRFLCEVNAQLDRD